MVPVLKGVLVVVSCGHNHQLPAPQAGTCMAAAPPGLARACNTHSARLKGKQGSKVDSSGMCFSVHYFDEGSKNLACFFREIALPARGHELRLEAVMPNGVMYPRQSSSVTPGWLWGVPSLHRSSTAA